MEHHIGHVAAVNQSSASNEKDCSGSPEDISSWNHNETLQHGNDRNEVSEINVDTLNSYFIAKMQII